MEFPQWRLVCLSFLWRHLPLHFARAAAESAVTWGVAAGEAMAKEGEAGDALVSAHRAAALLRAEPRRGAVPTEDRGERRRDGGDGRARRRRGL